MLYLKGKSMFITLFNSVNRKLSKIDLKDKSCLYTLQYTISTQNAV